ncbi:PREDICTED: uncharacterized protein LOC104793828 [Camelina sativa]|uniref:Uncharacterized protein LOC104793828 n=1 Tax=Camelina sativa TaxID=90675 RepID=A0ABM0ZP89_CAMSA|nr:PREDICTED: uncharacterized protein LOC104793828 [Camelina sativa]
MEAIFHKATSRAPGVDLMLKATQWTPFSRRLATIPVKRAVKPRLGTYDGAADPRDFLLTFGVVLGPLQFTPAEYDAGACQVFAEHLTGAALSWFPRLPSGSIDSVKDLVTEFLKQFSVLMENKNSHADLYALTQGRNKSLRSFISRFKEVVVSVLISDAAPIVAHKNALWYESQFNEEMFLTHVETIADALLRAAKHIEVKEEKVVNAKKHAAETSVTAMPPTVTAPKVEHVEPRQHFSRNPDRTRRTFAIGENKYIRKEGENNTTQYCDFHQSTTHSTEECRYFQTILMERYKKRAIVVESDRSKTP